MATSTSIHGHDVIHLINDAAPPLTRTALVAEVAARYGVEPRFHTCSAGGMTLDDLLAFLLSRDKVVERDGRLYVNFGEVCGGEGHGHSHDHEH